MNFEKIDTPVYTNTSIKIQNISNACLLLLDKMLLRSTRVAPSVSRLIFPVVPRHSVMWMTTVCLSVLLLMGICVVPSCGCYK